MNEPQNESASEKQLEHLEAPLGETHRSEHQPSLAKVKLRKEVTHSLRSCDGEPFLLVHDPIRSQFYRLGVIDWRLASLFDGERTLRQVVAEADSVIGKDKAPPADVSRLAGWLVQTGLAEIVEGSLTGKPQTVAPGQSWAKPLQQTAKLGAWNPLFLKFSLPNPQPILQAIYPLTSWMFSSSFFLIWLSVCVFGCYSVFTQWTRFHSSLFDVFSSGQWLQLLVVWLVLKVLHELGHAVCCMRYGGRVTRWGLMFIMFSPIAWVDVTAAWSFRSKWQRAAVSAAGMYIEFFLAAIAAIVWANTTNPVVATVARNVVISASFTTLLFNLNFLMRFDGYFILTDLLDIQNLYESGQRYLQYFKRRHLFGMRATPMKFTGWKLHFIRLYAFGAMIWRLVFYVGIVIVAAHLFHGAGLVLAVFSGLLWFGVPFVRMCLMFATGGSDADPVSRVRFATVSLASCLLFGGAMCLPWPGSTRAHGYVEYSPLHDLRVDRPGFVRKVHVSPGDVVAKDQVLLTMENPELVRELADLELQLRIQNVQRRVTHNDDDLASYSAAGNKVESLEEQRDQLASQIESLTVRAPIAGTVIANELDSLVGKFMTSGSDLLSVGSTGTKEVRLSIPQKEIETFRGSINAPVQLSIKGHRLRDRSATFSRVTPRATRRVLHPALAATSGGPLAVQPSADGEEGDSQVLVEASFEGIVAVPESLSDELHAGEICSISLGRGHRRVYEKLWRYGCEFFDRKSQT